MKKLSDEELFKLVVQDHERAFAILFDRYKVSLFRQIYQRTNSVAESEDILQNIFISLWKNRDRLEIKGSIQPYLMGAAKRGVFALYAKTAKEIRHFHLLQVEGEPFEYPAEEFLIANELKDLMDMEVQKMPSTMRKVFQLSRKEHISVREIASLLNVSEQTVKNNITMALQRLRLKLASKHIIQIIAFILFYN